MKKATNVIPFRDPYAAGRRTAKRARYVARLGRPAMNKRRAKRRVLLRGPKKCATCGYPDGGVCTHVRGVNFGLAAEVGGVFGCRNWRSPFRVKLDRAKAAAASAESAALYRRTLDESTRGVMAYG